MRRVRTSTWILIAVFLLALVAYFLVRPSHPASSGKTPTTGMTRTSATQVQPRGRSG